MALAANWNAEKHAFVSIPRKIVLLFPIYPSSTPPPPTDGRTPTDRHALFADEKASRGANTRGKGEREGSDEEGKQPTIKPSPSNIQLIRLRVLSLVCSAPSALPHLILSNILFIIPPAGLTTTRAVTACLTAWGGARRSSRSGSGSATTRSSWACSASSSWCSRTSSRPPGSTPR